MRALISGIMVVSLLSAGYGWAGQPAAVIYSENKLSIPVTKENPEFVIKLKSNPTTGYSWFVREYNSDLVQLVKHSYEEAKETKLVGAPGHQVWVFRLKPATFVVPHQTTIRFNYARPWDASGPGSQLAFTVSSVK